MLARFADATSERIVAEVDLSLWPVAIPWLADHFRQAVFAAVPVVPACLAVIPSGEQVVNKIKRGKSVEMRGI